MNGLSHHIFWLEFLISLWFFSLYLFMIFVVIFLDIFMILFSYCIIQLYYFFTCPISRLFIHYLYSSYRTSHWRCSMKTGVFKNFAKFTVKHLCQSLFFNNAASQETVVQVFSCEFWEIFKNTFFTEHRRVTAFAPNMIQITPNVFRRESLNILALHIISFSREDLQTCNQKLFLCPLQK